LSEVVKKNAGWSLAIDYGPLLVFFAAYKISGVFAGTAAFMVAIAVAVGVSLWRLGRVSPMLWLSAILVVGFGSLTLYFNDERFIQHKPTVIYALLGLLLAGGLMVGKPLLKTVLEAGYDGLSDRGWTILSRNWAAFFIVMAALNEVMVATLSFDTWLTVKVWGLTLLSFAFALANTPVLLKHGMGDEDPAVVPPQG
jgi:intracellular septation protein